MRKKLGKDAVFVEIILRAPLWMLVAAVVLATLAVVLQTMWVWR